MTTSSFERARLIAPSLRAASVAPFHAMAMARRATEREMVGGRVFHLEIGQPATPAPAAAIAAGVAAMHSHALGYTNASGLMSLRSRIVDHYADWYDVDVAVERVSVVAGASAGFSLAFLACFDAGQRVGIVEPGYPCYRNTLIALGIEPVPIPVGPATRWAPTSELLGAAGDIDGLIVASPSNPTGTVLDAQQLTALTSYCAMNEITVISDEIYHGITFTGPAPTMLAHDDRSIVVNSFSKYFSMTGWRLGWLVVPDELIDTFERLQQNLYICAPHISQVVGLAAFDAQHELDAHVETYRTNRTLLLDGLATIGISDVADADGAFYVYADISHIADDSMQLCSRWLDEAGVACTPGLDFDTARGHTRVRFSYATSADQIAGACEALAAWLP